MSDIKNKSAIKDILLLALNEPNLSMADEYIKVREVLKFIYTYFCFNIDEVAGEEVENLTLYQLNKILGIYIKNINANKTFE